MLGQCLKRKSRTHLERFLFIDMFVIIGINFEQTNTRTHKNCK